MEPSVVRNVHYVSVAGKCRAAIITGVYPAEENTMDGKPYVSLFVMPPGDVPFAVECTQSEVHRPDTWHWPERV
jgi:hypothetical protein